MPEGDCRELSMRLYECLEHGGECLHGGEGLYARNECEYLNVSV